ncbi:hypothetical protein ACWCPD_33250 [Streptomyces sp. NPDC001935]
MEIFIVGIAVGGPALKTAKTKAKIKSRFSEEVESILREKQK